MKVAVIVNPTAGFKRRHWRHVVEPVLAELGRVEYLTPDSPAGTTRAARDAEARGADVVIAAGGDGTVHRVINGLSRHAQFGILPVGTANDLANFIGVPPSAAAAAAAIVEGGERAIDTVNINGVRVHTVAGFLVMADAAMRADRMKRRWPWLGTSVYRIGAAISIAIHGGKAQVGSLIANQPTMGGHLRLPFESVVDDGRFEIATFAGGSRIRLVRTLAAMSAGKPLPSGAMTWTSVDQTRIEFPEDVEWFADGEGLGFARTFDIAAEPKALRIRGIRST
ncbi:MAG: hypothetical protein EPO35_05260 [Acidobacteria bacterium]|nr:MAG: hypothetical protein EPO35_05260 [Acidobacteriota bacterium]